MLDSRQVTEISECLTVLFFLNPCEEKMKSRASTLLLTTLSLSCFNSHCKARPGHAAWFEEVISCPAKETELKTRACQESPFYFTLYVEDYFIR